MLCFTAPVFAYPLEDAQTNLASDYAVCTAYYLISANAFRESHPETAQVFDRTYFQTLEKTILLSNKKVTIARVELSTKEMLTEIDNDRSNISILTNNFGIDCKSWIKEPEKRLRYWLEKER